mmetsp:Transcript_985/g.1391  ORF Transcript_985/g.1391 Transcript_985/m.1391 type:complete len:211 (+) Transcript_985:646-1278(+)
MTFGNTMRSRHTTKSMPFHTTLKSFALGYTTYIHILSWNKMACMYTRTRFRHGIRRCNSKLTYNIRWLFIHSILGIVMQQRFRHVLLFIFTSSQLHRIIPILPIFCLIPNNYIAIQIQNGTRMHFTPRIPHRHHTQFDGQSTTAFIAQRPSIFGEQFIFKVFDTVRHAERFFAFAWFPIAVLFADFFGFHFGDFFVEDGADFFLGSCGVD